MGGFEETISFLMDYTIFLTPSAYADMTIAKDYYNSKRDGLGKRMAEEVNVAFNNIASNPHAYSIRYRDVRAAKVSSFPYLVFYRIKNKSKLINILRVFNTHQQSFW